MCLRDSEKGTVSVLESLRGRAEGSGGRRKIERGQIKCEGTSRQWNESEIFRELLLLWSIRAVDVLTA